MDEIGLIFKVLTEKILTKEAQTCPGGKNIKRAANSCTMCQYDWRRDRITCHLERGGIVLL